MKKNYLLVCFSVLLVLFAYQIISSNEQLKFITTRNIVLKQTISGLQKQDNEVIKLYKQELELGKQKQKILDGLPFSNTKLYLEGNLDIQGIKDIDDKILEVRSERLLEEKKMFPYREGLDLK